MCNGNRGRCAEFSWNSGANQLLWPRLGASSGPPKPHSWRWKRLTTVEASRKTRWGWQPMAETVNLRQVIHKWSVAKKNMPWVMTINHDHRYIIHSAQRTKEHKNIQKWKCRYTQQPYLKCQNEGRGWPQHVQGVTRVGTLCSWHGLGVGSSEPRSGPPQVMAPPKASTIGTCSWYPMAHCWKQCQVASCRWIWDNNQIVSGFR